MVVGVSVDFLEFFKHVIIPETLSTKFVQE